MLLSQYSTRLRVALVPFLLLGCRSQKAAHPKQSRARILIFLDRTRSSAALQPSFVRYAAQIAAAAPAGTTIEACGFGSDTPLEPFYEGPVRHLSAFAIACQTALASSGSGRGTFGGPILSRVQDRLSRNPEPTAVVLITDGGFDDLERIRSQATSLARQSLLLYLIALPVVTKDSAYVKLEEALRPLGRRARLATKADAGEALRELQERFKQNAPRRGGK